MEKIELISNIMESCKIYSKSPYLGSDGFHHKYGRECISLEKLEEILEEYILNE